LADKLSSLASNTAESPYTVVLDTTVAIDTSADGVGSGWFGAKSAVSAFSDHAVPYEARWRANLTIGGLKVCRRRERNTPFPKQRKAWTGWQPAF
jgi:hypothetical protein